MKDQGQLSSREADKSVLLMPIDGTGSNPGPIPLSFVVGRRDIGEHSDKAKVGGKQKIKVMRFSSGYGCITEETPRCAEKVLLL